MVACTNVVKVRLSLAKGVDCWSGCFASLLKQTAGTVRRLCNINVKYVLCASWFGGRVGLSHPR